MFVFSSFSLCFSSSSSFVGSGWVVEECSIVVGGCTLLLVLHSSLVLLLVEVKEEEEDGVEKELDDGVRLDGGDVELVSCSP